MYYLLSPTAAIGRQFSCVVFSSRRGDMHFSTEIHFNLQQTSVTFSSESEEGSLMCIPLTVEGNVFLGFGGAGENFVRPAVPRHLKSLGSMQEWLGTSSQYVNDCSHLQSRVFKFISICVSHKIRSKNFHVRCPFCVGKWCQRAEALWGLFNRLVAPVIYSG